MLMKRNIHMIDWLNQILDYARQRVVLDTRTFFPIKKIVKKFVLYVM